ncbi:MAG: ABC transporter substrate-binding protein, partial [Xanthobacteraceae bacterium]
MQDAAERRGSGLVERCPEERGAGNIMGTKLDRIRRPIVSVAWLWLAILPAAADPVTLRYGQIPSTARSVSTLYLSIARQKGFLDHEQIRLELVPIAGGTDKMVAALDRGEVDVTQTATPYLIRAALSGSDATAIAGETANPVYSLIVKPQIQSFAELKGKTLGLSLPVDTISISMRKLLAL